MKAGARDEHPLSHGQQALWFLDKLAPGGTAYNFVVATRVFGATTAERLRSALTELVDRHAMLRTVFPLSDGVPVQRVLSQPPIEIAEILLPGSSHGEIQQRLADEAYRPFDLELGPVFRAAIVTRSGDEHYLLLSAHHIAIDFRSLGILLEDLGELHQARTLGRQPMLPPLVSGYVDYVRRQQALLAGGPGELLWQHWRQRLEGAPPQLALPTNRPRPSTQTFRGATVTLDVGRAVTTQLRDIARRSGVTLYTTILSAFQVLLHEWTGQEDVLVGCPTPARPPEFSRVVGYFVNPVVVRATLAPDLRFVDLLARVQEAVTAAWEHQSYPFALLVERLHPVRAAHYSPLFQVLFALYDLEEDRALPLVVGDEGVRVPVGDLQLQPLMLEHRGAMLDLSLITVNIDGRLNVFLQFNEDLFDRSTIEQLAMRFRRLLEDIVRDPTRSVSAKRTRSDVLEPAARAGSAMEFSLFFFASEDGHSPDPAYRLLLEAARFADIRGFSAIWTPERHFHPFGGIYPNPAVTGAAAAAITTRIQIRAGSVVLPLHHPVRVAEEWSVVDNISNGRAAVSFASGWHANDFVFAPHNYDERREVMAREIETVRKLWRGEPVSYRAGDGREIDVQVWPRPVQKELPIWVTAFGSPDTFRLAGELGAGVLTHLLGQSTSDLAQKIELYRSARGRRGLDPAGGKVAVMLHAFVGDNVEQVRHIVRAPFIAYLKTSVELARAGEQAGLAADGEHYRHANVDAFLEATFERYFATSTLFGTPETCTPLIERLREVGATEVACLIDFGVDVERVLAGLPMLDQLRSRFTSKECSAGSAQRAVARGHERGQSRKQAMERQARVRLAAGSLDGQTRKDGRA